MYAEHFKLTCRPFDLAPDPRFLWASGQHARAAANVRFALMNHDSFVVISGEIGTGKTTVLNTALEELGSQYVTARIVHTTLNGVEILQALLSAFGKPNYGTKRVMLLDELRHFFLEQHMAGRHVVIIVDEAQHLSPATLEELRLLTCIDSQDRRIVTVVLTGQPSLDDVLDDPGLAQLRQRTRLRQRLRRLEQSETADYIRHRVRVAGGDADRIFAPDVHAEIHRLTLGTPRLINTLCDTALIACMVDSKERVDMGTIDGVVAELGWRWADGDGRRERPTDEVPPGRPPSAPQPTLNVHLPGKLVARVDIVPIPFSIGRGPGNGLVIESGEISRRHALIDRVGDSYFVEDLNSVNGVYLNGKRCTTATLKHGDVIAVGKVKLVFGLNDESSEKTGEQSALDASNVVSFVETQRVPEELAPAKNKGTARAND
jgi:general secretion pathway protein A